jgi:hypothetical protein
VKKITLNEYRADRFYPRISRAVAAILARGDAVVPIEVFQEMSLLKAEDIENWRRGRIPYLEKVIRCNLSSAGRILRILRMHAHDLNLRPSLTAYHRWGKRPKIALRFSKSGVAAVEESYSRHFIRVRSRRAENRDHFAHDDESASNLPLDSATTFVMNDLTLRQRQELQGMAETPKRIRKLVREWAGEAHEEELRRALLPIAEAFDRWKRGDVASSELSNVIHKFHQGPARDLFVKYNTNRREAPVAHAIVSGILDKQKIPPELLQHLASWISFYEAGEADTHGDNITNDDENSQNRE